MGTVRFIKRILVFIIKKNNLEYPLLVCHKNEFDRGVQ